MRLDSPLVGRDTELASLRAAVRPGRMVAVTGAPGVGKTALIAEALRDRERVVWADVDGARSAEDLWAALGRAVGVALDQADRAAARLARALQGAAVVVLDAAELLDDGAWQALERLRRDCAGAWVVGSVVGPPGAAQLALEPLPVEDARRLLIASAAERALGKPVDEDDPAWTALAERLDGLPLAIRLAAGRLGLVSPRELLDRLDVAVLRGADRRGSVEGALRFAWGLLGERDQRALVALSPAKGGFTLPIAEGLLGDDAIVVLDGLRARSAVAVRDGRFRVLEGLRRIAAEHADDAVRARFVAFFGPYAARLRAMNIGTETIAGVEGLRAERENLRAAFDLATGPLGSTGPGAALAAAQLAIALVNALTVHGPLWEIQALGDLRAVAWAAPPREGSELLALLGSSEIHVGRRKQAEALLAEAMEVADRAGEPVNGRATALWAVGWLHLLDGDLEAGRSAFLAALDAAVDPSAAALSLIRIGAIDLALGDRDAAARALEEALRRLEGYPNLRVRGTALTNLGLVRAEQGRHVQARDLLARGLDDLEHVDRTSWGAALINVGLLRLVTGETDGVQAVMQEAMAHHLAYGSEIVAGQAAIVAALERWAAGDHRGAREWLVTAAARLDARDPREAANVRAWRAALEADGKRETPLRAELDAALADGADPELVAVLAALGGGAPPEPPAAETLEIQVARRLLGTPAALRLDRAGRWFERPGDRVDLGRRGALRRILAALVAARVERPGAGLSVQDLFEAGWPGERVLADAAAARVYNSIRELRALGVGDVLRREAEGYLLDPAVRLDVEG